MSARPMASTWEIDENPPFEQLGLELSRPGPIPGSVIQADDGTWVMYLWGIPAPRFRAASSTVLPLRRRQVRGWLIRSPCCRLASPGRGMTLDSTSRRWSQWVTATSCSMAA